MVAIPYNINSDVLKYHYGSGLPTFKGSRMQYGRGLGTLFKRVAFPLLTKGVKFLAPHLKKAAKGVVSDIVGNMMKGTAMAPMPQMPRKHKKRKLKQQRHSQKKKSKRSTSDIF